MKQEVREKLNRHALRLAELEVKANEELLTNQSIGQAGGLADKEGFMRIAPRFGGRLSLSTKAARAEGALMLLRNVTR